MKDKTKNIGYSALVTKNTEKKVKKESNKTPCFQKTKLMSKKHEHDVKRYLSGVRLDNQNIFSFTRS